MYTTFPNIFFHMIFPDTLHKSNNVEEQPLPDNKKNKKKTRSYPASDHPIYTASSDPQTSEKN